MIKLETHCHSLGGSGCAKCEPDYIVEKYKKQGYGGIVLTNHYCKVCYDEYPGRTHKQKLDFYFSLYKNFQKSCERANLKSFLGAEVRAVTQDFEYKEFMLYGFDEKLFYDNPPLFHLNQKQMFEFASDNGLFMYQTHPFRVGVNLGDYRYMHGAESFNGHINHVNHNALANDFCDTYKLVKMSGTDYHDPDQTITGGILIPDDINTDRQLTEYVMSGKLSLIEDKAAYERDLRAKER
ncbi:MAG: hypothetical protein SPL13_05165 [Clostridia bacterium]|nr:hypothetical protein [Clostridia bacterium]